MQQAAHHHPSIGFPGLLAFTTSSLLAVTAATAQIAHGDTSALDDSGNYREEVQACREGRTAADRATCLKEARNAAADKRRGVLTNQGDFQANAMARCEVHREKIDKEACRERLLGEGDISGSVAGGGLLRELEVTLPQEQQPRQAQQGQGDTGAMGAGPSQPAGPEPMQQPAMPRPQAPITPAPSYEMPSAPSDPGQPYDQQQQPPIEDAPDSGME